MPLSPRNRDLDRHVPFEVQGLLDLVHCVYKDACTECAVNPDPRDLETIDRRTEEEGLSFLTITLPSFCKDFERSLAEGRINPKFFRSFRKNRSIPALLQGMIGLLFDRTTGDLYDSPRADLDSVCNLVAAIRQICRCYTKLQAPCTPAREQEALKGFSKLEQSLAAFEVQPDEVRDFGRVSRLLWDPLFCNFKLHELDPKHGPGVTSEGTRGNSKYLWRVWHERLEDYFPFLGFCYPLGAACDFSDEAIGHVAVQGKDFEKVTFVTPDMELPSRVISVPKTLKGPRIIAAEPLAAQYVQQAIRSYLYDAIENYWLTQRKINFRDQSINQRLALIGSRTGEWSTLDLSDASDRVFNSLASVMFEGSEDLLGAIQACRTAHAKLPNGTLVGPLRKFASMGSALCFPVEAMYFYTICVVSLIRQRSLPWDEASVFRVSRDIFVYGDDIVVPSDEAAMVSETLLKYNSIVSPHKSFWTGRFRESCGLDAYAGKEVTPTYVRHFLPANRRSHTEIISLVSAANAFELKGYYETSRFLFNRIERLLGSLPVVSPDSPAVGRIVPKVYLSDLRATGVRKRWNRRFMRLEVLAWTVEPVYRTDELHNYAALAKSLMAIERRVERRYRPKTIKQRIDELNELEFPDAQDEHHLERIARHGVATLKRRWVGAT